MAEKIKYGISNVYAAVATIASNGSATYGTPFAVPGAVSLSLTQEGERYVFYADNLEYWVSNNNKGYSGDLELAVIPEEFKTDILNEGVDNKHVLYEDADAPVVHFALMFQFETDAKARKHVLYNCTCTRPNISGTTKNEDIEPQTETLNITASPIYNAALSKNLVKANTEYSTDATTYNDWNDAVYQPAAAATT